MALLKTRTSNFPAWLLLAALVALAGYQSFGSRPVVGPTKPAVIATFDLEKTFNSIEEKKAAFDGMLRMAEDMEAQAKQELARLKTMEADLDEHLKGSDKYKQLEAELVLATHRYRAQSEFFNAKVDAEHARTLKRVYLSIRQAAERMAEENGYAVVFVDDSISEIPDGTKDEINRQISARRMVYTSNEVDITDQLISRMNQEWKAAKPGGAVQAP